MKHKGLILIILSVICGVATFGGIFFYTSKLEEKITVVVVVQDIPPYTEITGQMLEVEERNTLNIPESAAPNIEVVEGRYTGKFGLYAGDIVTREKVLNKDEASQYLLNQMISPNRVAVALDVDLIRSVAGAVRSKDYVDVSVITDEFEVTPLRSIKILKVRDKDGNDIERSKMENPVPAAVVFEASPEVRDVLMKISDRGKIHLSLLNSDQVTETVIDYSAVERLGESPRQQTGETEDTEPKTGF